MYRASSDFRTLRDEGVIATVALDPPVQPILTVILSDGSIRQCPATDTGFAALLSKLKAEQDAENRA
ncbi:hypothetical protein GOFOIKOB_4508 [Methylobacterium tardum]|uniref:Uncharacterized protein n=1 Tax=Methylobacterium tardum TaxID=374432 RepID=A0AA37THJ8_9HYPH|nr:hypothetical protein [Methylobacterium tardum]URD39465.1 hypothetical protein M6G65_14270 [Methylobacterium tardum]GJE51449.1 hypothetical protein GOFOIKOB_4508 [Methylobacterium tardum]GLS73655.1 hypothetical protein GCM10007890_56700 [Methylobacterium tardum]